MAEILIMGGPKCLRVMGPRLIATSGIRFLAPRHVAPWTARPPGAGGPVQEAGLGLA